MIHITNLTKIYRSRHRSVCRALDKVNLTLPMIKIKRIKPVQIIKAKE